MAIELLPLPEPMESVSTTSAPGIEPLNVLTDCERPLTLEEIQELAPIFASNGGALPDPTTSTIVGAFRGGKLVAFLVVQLKVHAQPLYIEHGHSAVLGSLVKAVENHILSRCGPTWVYLFTDPGRLTELATAFGMEVEPWHVLSKLVMPKPPIKDLVELKPSPQISLDLQDEMLTEEQEDFLDKREEMFHEQLRTQ